jgi:biotin operon repressor
MFKNKVDVNTRKGRVLKTLRSRKWTPGYELTQPEVGGTEGLRRVRELRSEGYKIESRRMKDSRAFEYRLARR